MHLLEMLGQRKRTATEPPFTGVITELDGTPSDLSTGVTSLQFKLGTPGQTPIIDSAATFTNASVGEWEYVLTTPEAAALTVGFVLVHIVITYDSGLIEPVPFDHYFQLEILEML